MVRLDKIDQGLAVILEDDGKGFGSKALEGYGHRKYNRSFVMEKNGEGYILVGL